MLRWSLAPATAPLTRRTNCVCVHILLPILSVTFRVWFSRLCFYGLIFYRFVSSLCSPGRFDRFCFCLSENTLYQFIVISLQKHSPTKYCWTCMRMNRSGILGGRIVDRFVWCIFECSNLGCFADPIIGRLLATSSCRASQIVLIHGPYFVHICPFSRR